MGISPEAQLLAAQIAAWRRIWTAGPCGLGAGGRGGPDRSGSRSSVNTARAAHHPRQKITAAAARRKTKKISTPQTSRDGSARSDCTSTCQTLRVCLGRKWC